MIHNVQQITISFYIKERKINNKSQCGHCPVSELAGLDSFTWDLSCKKISFYVIVLHRLSLAEDTRSQGTDVAWKHRRLRANCAINGYLSSQK